MCLHCCQSVDVNLMYMQHRTTAHAELWLDPVGLDLVDEVLNSIATCDPAVFDIGQSLIKTVWNYPPS